MCQHRRVECKWSAARLGQIRTLPELHDATDDDGGPDKVASRQSILNEPARMLTQVSVEATWTQPGRRRLQDGAASLDEPSSGHISSRWL